jgi:hypothetical protein
MMEAVAFVGVTRGGRRAGVGGESVKKACPVPSQCAHSCNISLAIQSISRVVSIATTTDYPRRHVKETRVR